MERSRWHTTTDEGFKVISAKELEEAPVTDTNTEWKNGDIAYLDLQVVRFIGIDPCDVDYCYVTYASHYASHFMRRVLTSELSKTKPLTQEEKDEKNGEKLFSLHQGFASNYDGYPATTWMNASPCTKGSFTELAKKVDFEGKL